MNNIIDQDRLNNHTIQRYRFKVLNSLTKSSTPTEDINSNLINNDENSLKKSDVTKEIKNEPKQEEQQGFIEELLKKSDELSSNIIKLQIQIEKQEEEFQKRLEDELSRAKEQYFNEGYEKAKSKLQEEIDNIVKIYKLSAEKLDKKSQELDEYLNKIEKEIAQTAIEIAKEVINKEVSINSKEIAISLSKELIQELKEATKITIKVNPEDYDALNEVFKSNNKINVESDDAISKGGVILLSDSGNLDGSLILRLEKVKYLLQDK